MSGRNVQQTRTNIWPNSTTVCSAQHSSISTADPLLSLVSAPLPTLVIRFGASPTPLVLAPAAAPMPPVQRPYAFRTEPEELPLPLPQPDATPEPRPADVEQSPAPSVEALPEAAHAALPDDSITSEQKMAADGAVQPAPAEAAARIEERAHAEEAQFEERARAEEPNRADEPNATEEQPTPAPANRIELIIDSLPNHQLTEPIPVTIDALGDEMFTASMRDLDIAATGNSIGEALLFLKEQIDSTFDDLSRKLAHLTTEQKSTLQMLHTYIPPTNQPKSRWF